MRVQTPQHAFLVSFLLYTFPLFSIISLCGGCALRLPAPKIYHTQIDDPMLMKRLCPSGIGTVAFSLQEASHFSGAISCASVRTTVVLLNNLGIRVRTISLRESGEVEDEISYLSTNHTPTEQLLSLLAAALESADYTAKSGRMTARVS